MRTPIKTEKNADERIFLRLSGHPSLVIEARLIGTSYFYSRSSNALSRVCDTVMKLKNMNFGEKRKTQFL